MASAQTFSVNLTADDGGLMQLLVKAGVDARVISWLTGGGATDQGIDTLRFFVSSFIISEYEREISTRIRESTIPGITDVPRELNRAIAMLRTCYLSAASAYEAQSRSADSASAPPTAIPAPTDMDAPLGKEDQDDLTNRWQKAYGHSVQARLAGSDNFVGRTFREWQACTPSIIPVKKMRSQTHALEVPREKREKVTDGLSFVHHGHQEQEDIPAPSVIEYYQRLRMMANTWALVGNYEVPSFHSPGRLVTMMTYEQALNYADDALFLTTTSKVAPEHQLGWLKFNDEITRTKMMALMHAKWPASEALVAALDEHRADWRPEKSNKRSRSPAPGGDASSSNAPRKPKRHEICTHFKGRVLCAAYNNGSCNGKKCPKHHDHLCNLRCKGGNACGQKHKRCEAHALGGA